jgi:predicted nucleic acid-binding protein
VKVFVDTSALYALLDADDRNHESAKATVGSCLGQDALLVSSNYVILETIALIQRRLGMVAARRFCLEMMPFFGLYWVDEEVHAAALGTLLAVGSRDLSLVDCTSFELMRRTGVDTAFAFDHHFAEQTFKCLP